MQVVTVARRPTADVRIDVAKRPFSRKTDVREVKARQVVADVHRRTLLSYGTNSCRSVTPTPFGMEILRRLAQTTF